MVDQDTGATWNDIGPSPIWYLATPYMGYEAPGLAEVQRLDAAFAAACEQAAFLQLAGVMVYAPIVHGHAIASTPGGKAIGEKAWLAHGLQMLMSCAGLIECRLPGWTRSSGMRNESNRVRALGRPVIPMVPHHVPRILLEMIATTIA